MKNILKYISTFYLIFSAYASATNFNYGTGFAAKSELAHLSLINALEKVGDRIYGVGVHGIVIFSDDEGVDSLNLENEHINSSEIFENPKNLIYLFFLIS